jgi:hypothetical protein
MCLLVTQQYDSPTLTQDWIADFAVANADGVGSMYVEDGQLVISKCLFKSTDELVEFFEQHVNGRDCAFHFRMKTHGNIDMENCHPYEVFNMAEHGIDLWLMHNGVLHTGNVDDKTKSDTWHYIRNYIRPLLKNNYDLAFDPVFSELIGDHIGNNRFVLMDNNGRLAIINEDQGVYWGGRWMSNTYAWSAPSGVSKNTLEDMYNLQLAQEQVDTPPVKYEPYKPYVPYSYPKRYGRNPYYANNSYAYNSPHYTYDAYDSEDYELTEYTGVENDVEFDIDDALTDLELAGFKVVGKFSRRQANAFVERFGLNAFYEITEMVLDANIEEDSFVRIMSDFSLAKESFPFLIDAEKAERRLKEAQYDL